MQPLACDSPADVPPALQLKALAQRQSDQRRSINDNLLNSTVNVLCVPVDSLDEAGLSIGEYWWISHEAVH